MVAHGPALAVLCGTPQVASEIGLNHLGAILVVATKCDRRAGWCVVQRQHRARERCCQGEHGDVGTQRGVAPARVVALGGVIGRGGTWPAKPPAL